MNQTPRQECSTPAAFRAHRSAWAPPQLCQPLAHPISPTFCLGPPVSPTFCLGPPSALRSAWAPRQTHVLPGPAPNSPRPGPAGNSSPTGPRGAHAAQPCPPLSRPFVTCSLSPGKAPLSRPLVPLAWPPAPVAPAGAPGSRGRRAHSSVGPGTSLGDPSYELAHHTASQRPSVPAAPAPTLSTQ